MVNTGKCDNGVNVIKKKKNEKKIRREGRQYITR